MRSGAPSSRSVRDRRASPMGSSRVPPRRRARCVLSSPTTPAPTSSHIEEFRSHIDAILSSIVSILMCSWAPPRTSSVGNSRRRTSASLLITFVDDYIEMSQAPYYLCGRSSIVEDLSFRSCTILSAGSTSIVRTIYLNLAIPLLASCA